MPGHDPDFIAPPRNDTRQHTAAATGWMAMSNLIERLRKRSHEFYQSPEHTLFSEAADALEGFAATEKDLRGAIYAQEDEIKRLRADLSEMDWEQRRHTIERCVQVAYRELQNHPIGSAEIERIIRIIAAIKALNDQPWQSVVRREAT
jgi:hypothetical protein